METINVAKILSSCKTGSNIDGEYYTRLYSPIFPYAQDTQYNCSLLRIFDENGYTFIEVEPDVIEGIALDEKNIFFEYGDSCLGGECLLFPSQEVRDWGVFKAQYCQPSNEAISLLETQGGVNATNLFGDDSFGLYYIDSITHQILFTSEENLCNYIRSTGIEVKPKEQLKFGVGDVVVTSCNRILVVVDNLIRTSNYTINIDDIRNEVISNSLRFANPKEIAEWNSKVLQPKHLHYSKSKRKIVHWFKEFDKVVVRVSDNSVWRSRQFDCYDEGKIQIERNSPFTCQDGYRYAYCLPYNEKTAKLIGTTNDTTNN